jgi:hypothetical protein
MEIVLVRGVAIAGTLTLTLLVPSVADAHPRA